LQAANHCGKLSHGLVLEYWFGARFWFGHSGAFVNSFGYLRDRLFLSAAALYALNRWVLKPHLHSPFLRGHFNDLLLIPCALPPLLLVQRWLKLRVDDRMPTLPEVALYLLVWSLLFEVLGPFITPATTADPLDVLAYCLGGAFAALWWNRPNPRIPRSE
jgi:hypothetical protein